MQNEFDPLTGLAVTRKAGTGGQETNIQHRNHQWDAAGNLTSREDLRQSLTESFGYDALYRLTTRTGPGGSISIGYDAIGNITSKTGISGTFTYHPTRRHAVTNAGGVSYSYDANGNMASRGGATITWSSYNLPTMINAPNGLLAQFSYTPDRARWRQISGYTGGSTETTIYVGGLLEKLLVGGVTRWKHLIPTPSGQVQVVRRSDGTQQTLYVVTDHLGSTDAALDAAGSVAMRASFGVHGARRSSNWQGAPTTAEWQAIGNTTRDGYTGHEMLDNVELVHMNGRVFDPAIGRFLSADPFIDGVYSTQGLNRYAYVHGRLMSATDPSGFSYRRPSRWSGDWTIITDPLAIANILDQLSPLAAPSEMEGTITLDGIEEVVVANSTAGPTDPLDSIPMPQLSLTDMWTACEAIVGDGNSEGAEGWIADGTEVGVLAASAYTAQQATALSWPATVGAAALANAGKLSPAGGVVHQSSAAFWDRVASRWMLSMAFRGAGHIGSLLDIVSAGDNLLHDRTPEAAVDVVSAVSLNSAVRGNLTAVPIYVSAKLAIPSARAMAVQTCATGTYPVLAY